MSLFTITGEFDALVKYTPLPALFLIVQFMMVGEDWLSTRSALEYAPPCPPYSTVAKASTVFALIVP
jgi:hypothetical protein